MSFFLFFLCAVIYADSNSLSENVNFVISGAEFYQRSKFDSGEMRIFLQNITNDSLSINKCKLSKVFNSHDGDVNEIDNELSLLYFKLSPPIVKGKQNAELFIKLNQSITKAGKFRCDITDSTGNNWKGDFFADKTSVWIPYVGFSEDLNRVYIYVQNVTEQPLEASLLKIGDIYLTENYESVNKQLLPGQNGCLIFENPDQFIPGQYVHIAISAVSGDRKRQSQRIVRAASRFPLVFEDGSFDPKLGMDSEKFFVSSSLPVDGVVSIQNMACPAHAHGTNEEAAQRFLNNRYNIFSKDPYLLTQMWICRSDKPRAWYRFGRLADVSVMNVILLAMGEYESDKKSGNYFHPFYWLSSMAKKATAPQRYLACISLNPEEHSIFKKSYTPEELRFLVYCAIASGSKGIVYRGKLDSDSFIRDSLKRLNKELQMLKPLLSISEPVSWAWTSDGNYEASALLCGDEFILVIVFDTRYLSQQKDKKLYTPAFEKKVKPVNIKVAIGKQLQISKVESIYKPLPERYWNYQDGVFDFQINMTDSAQVYKLSLSKGDFEKDLDG